MNTFELDTLTSVVGKLMSYPRGYIFRGQASESWPLAPSLERILASSGKLSELAHFENRLLAKFKSQFHIYDDTNQLPESKLAWLSLMQHYGVPTRLLDFSVSPLVALFFAAETFQVDAHKNMVVYAMDHHAYLRASIKKIQSINARFHFDIQDPMEDHDKVFNDTIDALALDLIWVAEPGRLNRRIDRQGGAFVVTKSNDKKLDAIINSDGYADCTIDKLIVKGVLYRDIYALLRKANLTPKTIYGDIQGLASDLRMELVNDLAN